MAQKKTGEKGDTKTEIFAFRVTPREKRDLSEAVAKALYEASRKRREGYPARDKSEVILEALKKGLKGISIFLILFSFSSCTRKAYFCTHGQKGRTIYQEAGLFGTQCQPTFADFPEAARYTVSCDTFVKKHFLDGDTCAQIDF